MSIGSSPTTLKKAASGSGDLRPSGPGCDDTPQRLPRRRAGTRSRLGGLVRRAKDSQGNFGIHRASETPPDLGLGASMVSDLQSLQTTRRARQAPSRRPITRCPIAPIDSLARAHRQTAKVKGPGFCVALVNGFQPVVGWSCWQHGTLLLGSPLVPVGPPELV